MSLATGRFNITDFDPGILAGMVLFGLQKGFDTINHKILYKNMFSVSFFSSANCLVWILPLK